MLPDHCTDMKISPGTVVKTIEGHYTPCPAPVSAPVNVVHTIRTLDEWEQYKARQDSESVLLQCGSPVCARCPAFSMQIDAMKRDWEFVHVYVDTHDAEEDLLAELHVSKLPAYVLLPVRSPAGRAAHATKDQELVLSRRQNATPAEIEMAVRTLCAPVFIMDEDF